jgi:dihydrofolate reductase
MGKLIYSTTASADGYIEDAGGSFDWTAPDDEVFRFVSDLLRPVGTYLFGRRLYETMLYWETALTVPDQPPLAREFAAIWQAADKIVFSTTLEDAPTPRTKLERRFDPDAIRAMKAASDRDLSVGGPGLAAAAIRAGLVDELHRLVVPEIVGGGTSFLPRGVRLGLELVDERRFTNGTVSLHYRIGT